MRIRLLALLVALLAAALLAACGGDEESGSSETTTTTAGPAPLPQELAELAERTRRSVVRVQISGCERNSGSEGSGMVVGRRLVVTAAHLLEGAARVVVLQGGSGSEAELVAVDAANGLALVRTDAILLGQALRFSGAPAPPAGTVTAALGVPIGEGFEPFTATIADGPGSLVLGETQLRGLRLSEPLDRGLSGGPLLGADGRAAGVLLVSQNGDAGPAIALPAAVAQPAVAALRGSPNAALVDCDAPSTSTAPASPPPPPVEEGVVDPAALAAIIEHYRRIDAGEFPGAFELMSPGYRERNPEWPAVREAGSPAIDQPSLQARGIEQVDAQTALIGVSLIAVDTQGPDAGLCRLFTGQITMRRIDGQWLYDPSPGFGPEDVDQTDPRCARATG